MNLQVGDTLQATDCHGKCIQGKIINFLERTVIVESGYTYHVVSKKELSLQGYHFPKYKQISPFAGKKK